ncbi:MAG: hypothetical protein KBA26_11890 [Candidatus Delongbacteria bacterium]|nr:hypothetical protein [Candidatus Delongbacteria bacterium]
MESKPVKKLPELLLVKFKNNRKNFYYNHHSLELSIEDYVVVEAERGIDLGIILAKGKLADPSSFHREILTVIRKAEMTEIASLSELRDKEKTIFRRIKEHIKHKQIAMKLVDVESQFDGNKLTFFFTAEHRIDFRELVKDLASMYRTRIEMRQIGVRDEAQKLGGYGICGRALCCSQFLKSFKPISTEIAREQHLSLNPIKISGICGRLMCCLSYEHQVYQEALKNYPPVGAEIEISNCRGTIQEINIFKHTMILYAPSGERHVINVDQLPEIEYQKLLKIASDYHARGFVANLIEELPTLDEEEIKGDDDLMTNGNGNGTSRQFEALTD